MGPPVPASPGQFVGTPVGAVIPAGAGLGEADEAVGRADLAEAVAAGVPAVAPPIGRIERHERIPLVLPDRRDTRVGETALRDRAVERQRLDAVEETRDQSAGDAGRRRLATAVGNHTVTTPAANIRISPNQFGNP